MKLLITYLTRMPITVVTDNQRRLEQVFKNYFGMSMLKKRDGESYSTQEKSRERRETRLALTNSYFDFKLE